MGSNFDPNIPGMVEGEFTIVKCVEPGGQWEGQPNLVIRTGEPFDMKCEWHVRGTGADPWLNGGEPNWKIEVFAESMGPGPDFKLGTSSKDKTDFETDSGDPTRRIFKHTHQVTANPLVEGNPGDNRSGVYKLVVTCFLNSTLPGPGRYDLAGFYEGPMIQVEDIT